MPSSQPKLSPPAPPKTLTKTSTDVTEILDWLAHVTSKTAIEDLQWRKRRTWYGWLIFTVTVTLVVQTPPDPPAEPKPTLNFSWGPVDEQSPLRTPARVQ